MDYDLFKIVGAVAGIGGIALASVVYIFREVIRKQIFPQLTKEQAYNLLNRIIVLTFVIGVLGIIAYVILNLRVGARSNNNDSGGEKPPSTTQIETTAELWGYVRDRNEQPLQGARVSLDEFPRVVPIETASDGSFRLKNIPQKYGEMVRVRVIKEGYQPNPCTKDVRLGTGSHTFNLVLHQKPSRLPC